MNDVQIGVAVLLGTVIVVSLPYLAHQRRRAKLGIAGSTPRCPKCGYIINAGVGPVCSECGNALAESGVVNEITFGPGFPIYTLLIAMGAMVMLSVPVSMVAGLWPGAWKWHARVVVPSGIKLPTSPPGESEVIVFVEAAGRGRFGFEKTEHVILSAHMDAIWPDRNIAGTYDLDGMLRTLNDNFGAPPGGELARKLADVRDRLARGELPPKRRPLEQVGTVDGTIYEFDERAVAPLRIAIWALGSVIAGLFIWRMHRAQKRDVLERRRRLYEKLRASDSAET